MTSEESRQIPEDILLESELPEELLEPPELPEMQADVDEPETGLGTLEDEESEPDWQAEQRDAPAALRKLRNSFTGDLHPVLPSRTRSGGQGGENESVGGGEGAGTYNALCCNVPRKQTLPALLGAVGVKRSQILLESRRADHAIALQGASTMPTGLASYLPDEPTTLHEAKVSPEWPQWRGALKREMDGQIARGVWTVVDRPKEKKIVLGTKTVFKRKVGQDDRLEKYKCRFVAKGFRQIKGIHYQESSSPTPTQSSIRMALAAMPLLDWEGVQAFHQRISEVGELFTAPDSAARTLGTVSSMRRVSGPGLILQEMLQAQAEDALPDPPMNFVRRLYRTARLCI